MAGLTIAVHCVRGEGARAPVLWDLSLMARAMKAIYRYRQTA